MRDVEEGSFRNRTADFFWFLLISVAFLLAISHIVYMPFLGPALNYTITYFWSRQNPYVVMSFLGVFSFSAPYLPWVMMGISTLINNKVPTNDLIGIVLGHILWFFEEEWPRRPESNGFKLLKAPEILTNLFNNGFRQFNINNINVEQMPILNNINNAINYPRTQTQTHVPQATSNPPNPEEVSKATPNTDDKKNYTPDKPSSSNDIPQKIKPETIDNNPQDSLIEKLDYPTAIDSSKLNSEGLRYRGVQN
ncbi:Derlin-2 [Smittium culicis]|uniref:Derlin n=1 Tax=Smittium culicis TaxID=133412 RepID=A0A1R1YSR1_9FUNG|nr:Derlin-2 [Smittium culicis]